MSTLPLSEIVNVTVTVSPVAITRNAFNIGLIIGKSTIISAVTRVKEYASLTEMKTDGWAGTEAEYLAAQLYFGQTPRPTKVMIGRWDGTGTETAVEAVTACRGKNTDWYACMVCSATKTEIIAVASYIESCTPVSTYFYTTADADALAGTANNVMDTLRDSAIRRTLGQYSTQAHAVASIMGYAMGAVTGLANSAYTLAYKKEVGVTPETLTSDQVTIIKNQNGNVYTNRGSRNMFETGKMADGTSFDEVINLDILTNNIQNAVMDLLLSVPKIPQTESGVSQIVSAIVPSCQQAVNIGFLAPGVWNATPVLNLATGDTLPLGYAVIADSIDNQSQADRDARISPPIYVPIKLAGAIEKVTLINILVNR